MTDLAAESMDRAPYRAKEARQATSVAERIADKLGDARPEGCGWYRCRCPIHGGVSLGLKDGEDGLAAKCWAGCSATEIMTALKARGYLDGIPKSTPETPEEIAERKAAEERRLRKRIADAREIWRQCVPGVGTPIENYFAVRHIMLPIPPSIRSHPSLRHFLTGVRRPAMVAAVQNVTGKIVAIHCTWLMTNGIAKAGLGKDKLSLGPVSGHAVRLGALEPDKPLVVAEGIETAMSVMQATGFPAWAAMSANGIATLLLPSVEYAPNIIIAADNDANRVGQRAAYAAADRWAAEGRHVRIFMPPVPATDWNDVLAGRAPARFMGRAHAA